MNKQKLGKLIALFETGKYNINNVINNNSSNIEIKQVIEGLCMVIGLVQYKKS